MEKLERDSSARANIDTKLEGEKEKLEALSLSVLPYRLLYLKSVCVYYSARGEHVDELFIVDTSSTEKGNMAGVTLRALFHGPEEACDMWTDWVCERSPLMFHTLYLSEKNESCWPSARGVCCFQSISDPTLCTAPGRVCRLRGFIMLLRHLGGFRESVSGRQRIPFEGCCGFHDSVFLHTCM